MDWLVSECCKLWKISNNMSMNSLQCCNITQGKCKLNLCDCSFTVLLYYEDLSIRWYNYCCILTIDNLYFLQLLCSPPKANKMNFGFSVSICCLFKKCCFIAYAMFKKEIYLSVGNIFFVNYQNLIFAILKTIFTYCKESNMQMMYVIGTLF